MRTVPRSAGAIALALLVMSALAGCARLGATEPTDVSVIESRRVASGLADPAGPTAAILREATGLGLVRVDQSGQVIPGVAARWAIVDDGLDGIFRIDEDAGVSAAQVGARLRRSLAGSDRALYRHAIDRVATVTDAVVELRLSEPRSDLLVMLADPVLATLAPHSGPFALVAHAGDQTVLRARSVTGSSVAPPTIVRGERAGRAVARFVAGRSQLVLGGSFADLAVARVAALPRGTLRIDPAIGLFGLVVRAPAGPYADPAVMEALSLAIDRDRVVAALGPPGALKATTLAGSQIEDALDQRRERARALLAGRALPPLRLALPEGPGGRLLFRLLASDWAAIGIATQPAAPGVPADFALLDRVLPPSEFARAACIAAAGCDPADTHALIAPPYIPIGAPVRWSLVARRLDLFTENPLARHPLDRLRTGG